MKETYPIMTTPVSEELTELRRKFTTELPDRLESICIHFKRLSPATWQPSEAEELHRLLDDFTDVAGTVGMQSVSDVVCSLETRLSALLKTGEPPSAAEWKDVGVALGRLEQLTQVRLESNARILSSPPTAACLERSPMIYLVEDDPIQAGHLCQALEDDSYRVKVFTDLDDFRAACLAADGEHPSAVVMGMIFLEGDSAGASLIDELGLGNSSDIPVLVVSMRDDLPARLEAFRAGACRYLTKPVNTHILSTMLDALTGRQPLQPYRVLLVDDDPLVLELHANLLRQASMDIRVLSQPLQFLDVVDEFDPDVVVLDVYMPDASGPELAAVLRERDAQRHLPILFLSSETDMA
ncbi:MAG: response regulator, partial [Gammaproteobacteria bacterium]|nr:response regulator [Gammaproteobacteria bacterium]